MTKGQAAYQLAKSKNLSVTEWARQSGVTSQTIRNWRRGADIKLKTIVKLCRPIHADWTQFIFADGNGKKQRA